MTRRALSRELSLERLASLGRRLVAAKMAALLAALCKRDRAHSATTGPVSEAAR